MRVGFIGCGNVGSKLAGSLLRNGFDLVVRDLDPDAVRSLLDGGAAWADTPQAMAEDCDVIVTCLPSPGTRLIFPRPPSAPRWSPLRGCHSRPPAHP